MTEEEARKQLEDSYHRQNTLKCPLKRLQLCLPECAWRVSGRVYHHDARFDAYSVVREDCSIPVLINVIENIS